MKSLLDLKPANAHPPASAVRPWLDWRWQIRWGLLLAYTGLLTLVSLAPAEKFPVIPVLLPQQDKAIHFLLYGTLVWLARWAMAAHWMVRPAFLVVVAGAIAYGSLMEVLQGVLVNYHRHFEFGDIVANSLGALCFWWISRWIFVPLPPVDPLVAVPQDRST